MEEERKGGGFGVDLTIGGEDDGAARGSLSNVVVGRAGD